MTRVIPVLLVAMVAAISVSMISTASASDNSPSAGSSGKSCKLPSGGTLANGGELLEEDDPGYNVITCSNGRICVKAILSKHSFWKVCWYAPAKALVSGGSAVAPSITRATTG